MTATDPAPDHAAEPGELTLTEAAVIARRSEGTLRRWVAAGRLPARRVAGFRVLVRRGDLDRILAGEPVAPTPTAPVPA